MRISDWSSDVCSSDLERLGPVNWQFMETKKFDAEDMDAFLTLLPREVGGLPLRHALEVRHPSFQDPRFVELARRHKVALVYADHRSDERRVGKECVSTCRSRWSPTHSKKKQQQTYHKAINNK